MAQNGDRRGPASLFVERYGWLFDYDFVEWSLGHALSVRVVAVVFIVAVGREIDDFYFFGGITEGKNVAGLHVVGESECLADGFAVERFDDAGADSERGGAKGDGLQLESVVAHGVGRETRIETLHEICRRSLIGSRPGPIGVISGPGEGGEDCGTFVRCRDYAVSDGLEVAPRCGVTGQFDEGPQCCRRNGAAVVESADRTV